MNIFVIDSDPTISAQQLPDKHIVKMPLECCQMLSIVASSKWGNGYGDLPKSDGTPYKTEKGAFRNHPCTIWALQSIHNAYWLILHGIALCEEYTFRYQKQHSCMNTLQYALNLFPSGDKDSVTEFVRAMPEEIKFDNTIDTFTAYKKYINTKEWVSSNYLKVPDRKPEWVV